MIEDATTRYDGVPICNVIVIVNSLRLDYITGLGQLYPKIFMIKENFQIMFEEDLRDIGTLKVITR